MKKINNRGFILAETLVVTVFLMIIFAMLYTNFYPLIGEYEKREAYDDIDSKYNVFWLKRLIEDVAYEPPVNKQKNLKTYGFMRFECKDMKNVDEKPEICKNLVKSFEISSCDKNGNGCDIFITNYRIGGYVPDFKETVENKLERFREDCTAAGKSDTICKKEYLDKCINNFPEDNVPKGRTKNEHCNKLLTKSVFDSSMEDYIMTLPDYSAKSTTQARYRVIASFHHIKDNNNYRSYGTIEVNR